MQTPPQFSKEVDRAGFTKYGQQWVDWCYMIDRCVNELKWAHPICCHNNWVFGGDNTYHNMLEVDWAIAFTEREIVQLSVNDDRLLPYMVLMI